ncbi:MAG: hypothetical protein Q8S54_11585 [Bacteroidota bacterium]|nr:hypothetical protein [Odoribacter sp.]MDP3643818.1 hypothetical protein [Bacteroidota bacterium]
MKSIFTTLILILATLVIQAQFVNPEIVVIEMPVITIGVCKKEVRLQFLKQVDKLRTEVEEEITQRRNKSKTNSKGLDEQAAKNMMSQMGFSISDAEIQKMKTASKEEKKAMADKMLQQNMNMSIDEVQKVSKMSKAGKQAWAEGMTTEMMADAQANPDKYKAAQKNNMGMFEMTQEQSQLAQKIQLVTRKFEEQLEEFNKLKEKSLNEYEACWRKVDKDYENKINFDLGDTYAEAIEYQKNACYQACCGYLTPKYAGILLERFNDMIALGDDYNRMDELTNELAGATTGTDKRYIEPGLTYLDALLDYIVHLQDLPAPYYLTKN